MGFFFNGLIDIHARGPNFIHNFDFNCDFVIFSFPRWIFLVNLKSIGL
jgi:hypothetical protein